MQKIYVLSLLLVTVNLAFASDNASMNFEKIKTINVSRAICHKFERTTTSILVLYSLIEPDTITSACIRGTFINRIEFIGEYGASRRNKATNAVESLPNPDVHFKDLQALYDQTQETPATTSEAPIEKKSTEKKQG